MTDSFCGYPGDRDEALVAFLYDDGDGNEQGKENARERARFDAHLTTCARCRQELHALSGVRTQLARWSPPEPTFMAANLQSEIINLQSPWWRQVPAWAQVAAALLLLGVSAGIANLDVRYDASGLSVRTGWSQAASLAPSPPPAPSAPSSAAVAQRPGENVENVDPAPWRADLAALERQLKTELRPTPTPTADPAGPGGPGSKDLLRRMRVLLDESEKRQQRELALRVAEVIRDLSAQRQADLVKIDRTLGAVQNNLGVEVMKDRQRLNSLLIRTSGRQ